MAVIRVDPINDSRDGEEDEKAVGTFTASYRVQTNDPLDGPYVVINDPQLPQLYSAYSVGNDSLSSALCIGKTPRPEGDSRKSWIVTCRFSTNALQFDSNPLNDPIRVSLGFDQFTRIAREDKDGNPVGNSLGDMFDPPPEIDDSRPVYKVIRNESYINESLVADMKDSVNEGSWRGFQPRCVKCKSISPGDLQIRNGTEYYAVVYEFHINGDTWDFKLLNRGRRYKEGTKIVAVPKDQDPVVIDTRDNTRAVNTAEAAATGRTETPVQYRYVTRRLYKERDFGVFNL